MVIRGLAKAVPLALRGCGLAKSWPCADGMLLNGGCSTDRIGGRLAGASVPASRCPNPSDECNFHATIFPLPTVRSATICALGECMGECMGANKGLQVNNNSTDSHTQTTP